MSAMDKPNFANFARFAFYKSEIFTFIVNFLNISSFKILKALVKLFLFMNIFRSFIAFRISIVFFIIFQ